MVRTFILPFLLALINITAQAQSANIVGFEYWFDQNDTARSYVPLAPNATVNISNQLLNTTGLSLGQHVAHFRLKDVQNGNVRWSVVTDRALTVGQPGPYELVAVRYWWSNLANPPLDTDLRYKYFDTPQTTVQYNGLLDLCGFPTGSQLLKLQLLDNHGQWSSVVTRPVQIDSVVVVGIASISPSSMNFCPGDTVTFTATPQIGAGFATPTSYAWTVPTTDGWSAVSSTTESITVTIGNSAGNVEVVASNYCGSSVLASFAVTIPEVPAQPGPITGPLQACAGSDAVFSVPALEDLTYAWAITDGWVATGGPGASIATTIGEADAQIAVTPINACNVEGPPRIEQIVVTTPPNAGVNSSLDLCSNSDPIDLFEALNGNPETGGTWNGPNPTSGSYDPASMEPGDYVYTVSGMAPCPDAIATVIITVPQLQLAAVVGPAIVDEEGTLQFDATPVLPDAEIILWTLPAGWEWNDPDTTDGTAYLTPPNLAGFYEVCAVAINAECTGDTVCFETELTVGIANELESTRTGLVVYPNPSTGLFHIVTEASIALDDMVVIDAVGREVSLPQQQIQQGRMELDLREIVAGAYILRLRVQDEWRAIPIVIAP